MTETKPWRLWIDGEERTDECAALDFGTPALVYDMPHDNGRGQRRHLGPKGFWIALTAPSERLRALVDGGKRVHQIRVAFGDQALPVPVVFHEEWAQRDGVRKMFGCMPLDRASEPKWVTEPDSDDGGRRPLTLAVKEG